MVDNLDDIIDTIPISIEKKQTNLSFSFSKIYQEDYHLMKQNKCYPTALDFSSSTWYHYLSLYYK